MQGYHRNAQPTIVKEVQRLIGRLTAISRFLPKLAEQTQPII